MMQGKEFVAEYMIQANSVANASSAVFSRSVAISIDKQYMTMRGVGDWLFWIELMEHGNVFFSAKELNFFRFHHTNTTKSLGFLGISGVEHKRIFDYLVSHHFIPRSKISIEKLKLLDYHMRADYESRSARRKVMKAWDKWLIGRCHIFLSSIKEDIKLFLRNL
jgi:hypothetical protein